MEGYRLKEEELQAYKDHLREGLVKYTRKAFKMLPRRPFPCILDIGCGSGVPTMELAKLSDGEIVAIDTSQTALDRLASKIKRAGLAARVKTEKCSMLNMDFTDARFDIIWAEGSIAVIGFEKGLKEWRRLLKTVGFLVIHDDLDDITEKRRQISQCGYELINHFVLSEDIWWNEYYSPLDKKLNEILPKHTRNMKTVTVMDNDQLEIDRFKREPERYRSVFFVMRKSGQIGEQ